MKKTYKVIRQHYGDIQYYAGDERVATESDVQHLVENGVLVEIEQKKLSKKTKD